MREALEPGWFECEPEHEVIVAGVNSGGRFWGEEHRGEPPIVSVKIGRSGWG
jgi:hypothetical protein